MTGRLPAVFCFDLDDTLVSECDYVESGLRAAGACLDGNAGLAGEWLVALWRRERARDSFQRLLRDRGLEDSEWLPRLKAAYRDHTPALQPRDGCAELIAAIVARGDRLALLTDGYFEVQRRKWAVLGLVGPFDPVVFTDEMGAAYWKPHPWGFERVMRAHPRVRRFIYVGDNPAKDFIAPNQLGWTTVLVRDERNVHPCAFTEREPGAPTMTFDSLPALVAGLCRVDP